MFQTIWLSLALAYYYSSVLVTDDSAHIMLVKLLYS